MKGFTVTELGGDEGRALALKLEQEFEDRKKELKSMGAKSTEAVYVEGNEVRSVVRG